MLKYKGYKGTIFFAGDNEFWYGEVQLAHDLVTYEAKTLEDLEKEFKISVDVYLEFCAERGKEPDSLRI